MKQKSLLKNTFYYLVYNILNLLFPLISGIYAARVLSPQSIGEVGYSQNIVQYFVILSFLGIPTYGVREIANIRENKKELNRVYSELFFINFLSTIFFLTIYFILILNIDILRENLKLYLIMGILLFFNIFNINWLYEGLEEFKFISLRNIVFKILSLILLILFVRKDSDYLKFALITIIGTLGNYLINIIYSKKYVTLIFKDLSFKRHIKSILYLVTVNIAIEVYTLVDVSMLGFFCAKEVVAYYIYGNRIYKVLLQIMNTFTMVVVPRLSWLYIEKKFNDFNSMLSKTVKLILILGIPMIIGIQYTTNDIVVLIYGEKYMATANIIKLMSILLVLTPLGYLLGSRILLITKNENKMILAVFIGAVSNTIGNFILIRYYSEMGAALSTTISEIIVTIIYIYLGRKYYKINLELKELIKILIANLSLYIFLILTKNIEGIKIIKIIIQIFGGTVTYFFTLIFLKEKLVYEKYIEKRCLKLWKGKN